MDHKGKIEQVYSMTGDVSGEQRPNFGAVFASGCKTVLFGSTEGNLLVWDKAKGDVICGLDHGECGSFSMLAREQELTSSPLIAEQVQAVAVSPRGSWASIVLIVYLCRPLTEDRSRAS